MREEDNNMLSPLQERLLEMLSFFHDFCQKEGIRYYLLAGTMLGAERHRGFIPWDDDVDVGVPRPDYERLIRCAQGFKGAYTLESFHDGNEDFYYSFAKLYDKRTTLVEKLRLTCVRGVYIDVFPLDGLGSDRGEATGFYRAIDVKRMILAARVCEYKKGRGLAKNLFMYAMRLIPRAALNEHRLIEEIDRLASSKDYDSSEYVASCMSPYRYKEIMPKGYYGKPKLCRFNGLDVFGVEKPDKYLSQLYGDWRKLPPEGERHGAHEYKSLDLYAPFIEAPSK